MARMRDLGRRPAVGALAAVALVVGASTAAASGDLRIFQARHLAPVGFSTADLVGLPDLSAYGDVDVTRAPDLRPVADAAAAAAATGLDVPRAGWLPRGVSGPPAYQVGGRATATFTFSGPPAGLAGTRVDLATGPGVAAVWSHPTGRPSLVVGRVVAPSATSPDVDLATLRRHLQATPGAAGELAEALGAFDPAGSTLPLPVPTAGMTASSADVGGVPATVLVTRDATLAAVVWLDDGVVGVVAGPFTADEVLAVARGLR